MFESCLTQASTTITCVLDVYVHRDQLEDAQKRLNEEATAHRDQMSALRSEFAKSVLDMKTSLESSNAHNTSLKARLDEITKLRQVWFVFGIPVTRLWQYSR